MDGVRSAALGFFVANGSRGESDAQAGLSHFLEHLLFKGTERFGSVEIDRLFDGWGAELNAGTDKESTTVYARMLDTHLADAFDVMADMVARPALAPDDVDPERQVVIEEIAMYLDDPQDTVFDVLGEAVFGDHPLGRSIIGRAPVVAETPVDVIRDFHAARYVPDRIVVAAAGSVDHDAVVELARAMPLSSVEAATAAESAPVDPPPDTRFVTKDTEQVHVCLGGVGLPRFDERRFGARVLDAIFGGLSSSRLFQAVREERGLAYSVFSFSGQFSDTGQVGLYLGTRPDNLAEAMSVVAGELERLRREPATAEELERAKENVKARVVLGLESSAARMNRLGSSILFGLPLLEPEELMERIDAVSLDVLGELAAELWAPERLSAAGIGPDEDAFRSALEAL
jgi:predicted Zn-dependent peptidase